MDEKDEGMNRRDFLKRAAGAAVGLGAAARALSGRPAAAQQAASRSPGPNDKIVLGFIGTGGQGRGLMGVFSQFPDVEIAAVCDVYEPHLKQALQKTASRADAYRDYRRLLDRKDIDAVVIATPDHWHALTTIHACQAGKDVYVEKPLTLAIAEGRAMVRAARRYDRVVQVGLQQRGGEHFQKAVEIVSSGQLGKITFVETWNFGNETPNGIGNPPDGDPPEGLDWDMWLGPAPKVPYNPNRCIYNFRWFWDYSGGKLTDWGTHLIDVVQWAMGVEGPVAVSASGGKLAVKDNRETPDTLEVAYEYPGFVLTYTYRGANGHPMDSRGYGIQFYGSNGTLFVDRGGFELMPEAGRTEAIRSGGSAQSEPHARNFLDCIRSRQRSSCDVEIGHRSTSAPHLGNIALWTGRKIRWDAKAERIIGDEAADKRLSRPYRKPWMLPA